MGFWYHCSWPTMAVRVGCFVSLSYIAFQYIRLSCFCKLLLCTVRSIISWNWQWLSVPLWNINTSWLTLGYRQWNNVPSASCTTAADIYCSPSRWFCCECNTLWWTNQVWWSIGVLLLFAHTSTFLDNVSIHVRKQYESCRNNAIGSAVDHNYL